MTGDGVPHWFDPSDERASRAAWSRLAEPGDTSAGFVVDRLGAAGALLALMRRPHDVRDLAATAPGSRQRTGQPPPGSGWSERLRVVDPYRDLHTVTRFGGRLIIPGDAEWPDGLDQLGPRRPTALWARGGLGAGAPDRAVALVGSRASTEYGEQVAEELAAGCVERGLAVVSGAAYGIDARAHAGALAAGGATVAVLACGVDRAYPRGNERLIEQICGSGLVISEMPPGSSPTRWRFVQRNRLIAAMTRATVVVQAGWRSGASITASEANALGRPVGAVPGPVTSAASAGCHRLLRDGAVCVTDADEIVELIAELGAVQAPAHRAPVAEYDGMSVTDLRVFDALPVRAALDVDRLVTTAGLDEATVLAALGRLELRGSVVRNGARWRRAPTPRR